jgi:hypothetical protein
MRLWYLAPVFIDDKRLLAINNELHALHTLITKRQADEVGGWGYWRNRFYTSLHYVKFCHDNAMSELLYRRTGSFDISSHKSIFDAGSYPHLTTTDYHPTDKDIRDDIISLRSKWENEGYYFGVGRLCLTHAERQYDITPGLPSAEAVKVKVRTRALVKQNPSWFPRTKNSRMVDRLSAFYQLQPDQHHNVWLANANPTT